MFLTRLVIVLLVHFAMLHYVTGAECIDREYTYDPYDCNAYFQCSFGVFIQRFCPPNLHFNRYVIACDFPVNANCTLESSTTETDWTEASMSPTPAPDSALPPTPPPGPTLPLTPPPDATLPSTTPPPYVTQPPTQPTTTTTTTTTSTTTTSTTTTSTTTTPLATTTSTTSTGTSPFTPDNTTTTTIITLTPSPDELGVPPRWSECPIVDGPFVVHLPHPNCTMFYKCVHGIPHEMICPENQHWSIESDRCEFQFEASCEYGLATEQAGARPPGWWGW